MSDSPFEPGVIEELKRQAAWKADQDKLEASLTPLERRIRAKFERALFGPAPPPELEGVIVHRPESLLAMAQAYFQESRWAGVPTALPINAGPHPVLKANPVTEKDKNRYMTAGWLFMGVWMVVRGHKEFVDHFSRPTSFPGDVPPLPRNWADYLPAICEAFGVEYVPPEKVVSLFG